MAYEQLSFCEQPLMRTEKCCDTCDFYSALKEPRQRSDGAIIYGYCFKAGDKDYSSNMGKGYAVFIKDGFCKQFKAKRQGGEQIDQRTV